jgi:hypothetical protein
MSGEFVGSLAILSALVLVPLLLIIIFGFCERAWEHFERMKALEHGRAVPDRIGPRPLWQALLVGVGVPMLASFGASLMRPYDGHGSVWTAVSAVSLLAAIPSVLAAMRMPDSGRVARSAHLNGKPVFDPDAYDTISR